MRSGTVAASVLMVAVLAWCGGFGWFVHSARQAGAPPPQADGVVALTGGTGRIEAALRLLADGRGAVLLISGVGPASELADIVRRAGFDPAAVAGEITLGRAATTTMGNADETAQWARARNVRTLIVVTAGYHMARAMTELGRALPGVMLIPDPVLPPAAQLWQSGTIRLLISEYMKFLIASAGFSRLFPIDHPSP